MLQQENYNLEVDNTIFFININIIMLKKLFIGGILLYYELFFILITE